jgi:hypothetical protein
MSFFRNGNWADYLVQTMIVLNVAAAIGYAFHGDWKQVLYWASATTITIAVFLMRTK